MKAAAIAALALAACGQDAITVAERGGADHNRAALLAAARQCRTAGNSPEAFVAFAQSVLTLRVGMDETVADEAELLILALALDAVAAVPGAATGGDAPMRTVWPIGLAPRITAPVPGRPLSDAWSAYLPGADEDAARYAMRLCGAQLAPACGHIVPEGHAAVVAAVAIERFTDRVRAAVANCVTCGGDVWRERIAGWEALDDAAVAYIEPARQRNAVARWPVAGPGARAAPAAPTLVLDDDGGIAVDGEPMQQAPAALELLLAARRRGRSTLMFSGYARAELAAQALGPAVLANLDVLIDGRYRADLRHGHGLRGSANQAIHLLTARHTLAEVEATPEAEVTIGADGSIALTGVAPLTLRALR